MLSVYIHVVQRAARSLLSKMLNPPPDQRTPGTDGINPATEQIKRVAAAFETYTRNQHAADAEHAKHNRKIRSWTRAATVGAIVYTLITAAILIASIRSIQEARRSTHYASRAALAATDQVRITEMNFRMDQRPYVLIEDVKGKTLDFKKGEKGRWDIQYVNYGKSPSVKGATTANVWVGKTAVVDVDNFFKSLPTTPPPTPTAFIIPPNAGAAIGQNGFHFTTLFSETAVTEDDTAFMRANDGGVIMAGRTWYTDVFGDFHSTDFCRYTLISGAVSDCPYHNEVR